MLDRPPKLGLLQDLGVQGHKEELSGALWQCPTRTPTRDPDRWVLVLATSPRARTWEGLALAQEALQRPQHPSHGEEPPCSLDPCLPPCVALPGLCLLPVLAAMLPDLLQFKDGVGAGGTVPRQARAHRSHGDDSG